MIKRILYIMVLLSVLCFGASCELFDMIPKYQFSTSIPKDYISGKYYYTPTDDPSDSIIVLRIGTDTSFVFDAGNEDVISLLPANGRYTVTYSSFSVLSASGTIVFENLESGVTVNTSFVWTADAEEGPLSLRLTFPDKNNTRFTLIYGGKN